MVGVHGDLGDGIGGSSAHSQLTLLDLWREETTTPGTSNFAFLCGSALRQTHRAPLGPPHRPLYYVRLALGAQLYSTLTIALPTPHPQPFRASRLLQLRTTGHKFYSAVVIIPVPSPIGYRRYSPPEKAVRKATYRLLRDQSPLIRFRRRVGPLCMWERMIRRAK